jgi:hypothetical protein
MFSNADFYEEFNGDIQIIVQRMFWQQFAKNGTYDSPGAPRGRQQRRRRQY